MDYEFTLVVEDLTEEEASAIMDKIESAACDKTGDDHMCDHVWVVSMMPVKS